MVKCVACGKYLAMRGGASCIKCANKYHLSCAKLPENAKVSPNWRCMQCCSKTPEKLNPTRPPLSEVPSISPCVTFEDAADGVETGGQTSRSPSTDISHEIRSFRAELREMRDELRGELRGFRREIVEIREALGTYSERVERLESRLEALEMGQAAVTSESVTKQLESTVAHLKLELNDREQELISSDLEIVNLPERSGENVPHTVELVAKKLGVVLNTCNIVFAERVGLKRDNSHTASGAAGAGASGDAGSAAERGRRVVVRLLRRQLRDDLLRAARVRRGATSADLGFDAPPRRFYLNERLTKANRQLFYRARQAASQLGWKYAWTKHGRVLAKQGDGKRTFSIRCEADLDSVFGHKASEIKKD